MNKNVVRLLIVFISYLAIQVLLGRNLVLYGKAFCFVYLTILLLLPLEINRIYLLLLAFFTGITIDLFYTTPGMHAAALVFTAFIRPFWVNLNIPRGGYELGIIPNLQTMGFSWFFVYSLPLIFTHHFTLFYLEAGTLQMFWFTMIKVFFSTLFSFTVIVIFQYLFHPKHTVL